MRTLLVTIGLWSAGCAGRTERYEALREVCGMRAGEYTPSWFRGTSEDPHAEIAVELVTAECASAVGGEVNLNWVRFQEEPVSFDSPETPAQVILAGVIQLLAVDLGTNQEMLDGLLPDEGLSEMLAQGVADELAAHPTESAGALWLQLLREGITEIYPGTEGCEDGALAFLLPGGDLNFCSQNFADFSNPAGPAITALLVHEASHAFLWNHTAPNERDDLDWTRVHGVEARYLHDWRARNPMETRDPVDCWEAFSEVVLSCGNIYDDEGFPPCEDTNATWGECEAAEFLP